jgi:hypothetical protein
VAVFLAAIALVAEWTVSIPPAHMPETFGYQAVACWAAVAGLAAALVLEPRLAAVALVVVEAVLLAWFGWAAWVVSTPRFTSLGFPFLPTDVIGSGFYVAWAAVVAAAGAVTWELWRRRVPLGADLWLLTAVPGFGLVRMGRWASGLALTALIAGTFYLASSDSPDSTQFADYGRFGTVPPAYPRGAGWVLLAMTLALSVVGVALTVRRWRKLQSELERR